LLMLYGFSFLWLFTTGEGFYKDFNSFSIAGFLNPFLFYGLYFFFKL